MNISAREHQSENSRHRSKSRKASTLEQKKIYNLQWKLYFFFRLSTKKQQRE